MPTDVQLVKLKAELADLDQQKRALNKNHRITGGQKVLLTGCLQHLQHEKSLEIQILRQQEVVRSCERQVEDAHTRYQSAQTPDGLRVLLDQEMRRARGMALGGGSGPSPSSSDRLPPEQRVLERSHTHLTTAEDDLRHKKGILDDLASQLSQLKQRNAEWAEQIRGIDEELMPSAITALVASRPSSLRASSKAPPPITPVRGTGWRRSMPNPTEVPTVWPPYYPAFLKLETELVLADTTREVPERSELERLCRLIVPQLQPLFCSAVSKGTLEGHAARDQVAELLWCVIVVNCDAENERFRVNKAIANSDEWRTFVDKLVQCESAANSLSRRFAKKPPNQRSQRMAKARESLVLLWRDKPNAAYKDILQLADEHRYKPPWKDCLSWQDAWNAHEGAVKSLLAKTHKIARTSGKNELLVRPPSF